ncbi:histone-lysine N-methyltransferase EHMT1a isoform X2 [Syngnathoides biaculeatus]|uniref:histone-lysine N-methyltransferase EHMT1a isoform X2 n=1 Tax=Syngnathoides biaculeatus TaxID=300417 RepID=UPI002ADD3C4D|nr:histone-lysine N-methyltransferase EHMT1a isoform X2 [Syngnathoides biaculeatus]
MDYNGAKDCPRKDRAPFSNFGTAVGNMSNVKATPFHIVSDVGFHRSSIRTGSSSVRKLAPSCSLLLGTSGQLNARLIQKEVTDGTSEAQTSRTTNDQAWSIGETHTSTRGDEPAGRKTTLDLTDLHTSNSPDVTEICVKNAVKKKKRKMGLYNFVPKKKGKPLKHTGKIYDSQSTVQRSSVAVDGIISVIKKYGEGSSTRSEPLRRAQFGEASYFEYTELNLDCLDLKGQEELLLPHSTAVAEVTDSDVFEELPLCCCRIETPSCGGRLSDQEKTCMALENTNGMLNRCQRQVMKHEMMRPSTVVHLLVLCERHRASMVKHQCCPGCGLFCSVGTFMECRPNASISHRFHKECASILKDHRFCPHCGENASGAKEVTVLTPTLQRSNTGLPLPAVPTKSVTQILKAKKTCKPQRSRETNFSSETAVRVPNESLESILTGLDDENLKPAKVSFSTRQLYISAKEGELQRVIHLLVDGKDPNFFMDAQNKHTPLHAAATEGHEEICHMLIQAGAYLEMFDEEQRTPLMAACENNHLETVKYLIRAGAAINHKDVMGFTCLHLASKLGHYDIVQHLLSRTSKNINCQDEGGWTPITWAIGNKHKEVFYLLLAKGADVTIRDKEQNICLHWAALSGCADVTQALLDAQCDQNAVNIHGDLPIHVAARENHLECVTLFLCNGVNLNQKNRDGQIALDCCIKGSKVWVALHTSKKLIDTRRNRDCLDEQLIIRDISRGYEAVPINCVNGVDDEPYPGDFKYIPDNCFTSPVNIDKDITHLQHCSCTDDCSSSNCTCGQLSLKSWYDSEGRLLPGFCQQDPPVLFECNHACACWKTCKNRVVQNGLRLFFREMVRSSVTREELKVEPLLLFIEKSQMIWLGHLIRMPPGHSLVRCPGTYNWTQDPGTTQDTL